MRDVTNDDHHKPWQVEMPLISIPTETVHTHVARPDQEPPSTTEATYFGTKGFPVGIDTCGFTTGSTVTCDFGYDCTNVGNYRGCCVAGAADCLATIYTECIDYEEAPNSDGCGQHTLCCPTSKPSCFIYVYSTESNPGSTLTYVECNESRGFGELFPFPPSLMTATSEPSSSSDSSSSDSSTDEPEQPSSHSKSAGAIIGGVIGGVVFILLIILAAVLLLRYRRRRRQAATGVTTIPLGPAKTPHSSTDTSPSAEKAQPQPQTRAAVAAPAPTATRSAHRKLPRSLSMIREHAPPIIPTASAGLSRNKSTSATTSTTAPSRGSFGPNWPLGPASNPLAAHPVDARLRKRLSGFGMADLSAAPRVPPLSLSRTPPPPGSRHAPPKSPRGAGLRSPRLEYVPVSPIEGVAFGAARAGRGLDGRLAGDGGGGAGTRATGTTVATGKGMAADRDRGMGVEAEPVSPIGSDDGEFEEDTQRFSYVSAPSAHFEGDELVSPVSPHGGGDGDEESPRAVSPLESRRGSVSS
ncbi:hypothetical protein F4781DRAFT_440900 [Annulohypoxylon bovei var. microspora]|nr:hypothetical protein F4781DRAFT_440900 [Annulohypoxylon bovei var. microspora]